MGTSWLEGQRQGSRGAPSAEAGGTATLERPGGRLRRVGSMHLHFCFGMSQEEKWRRLAQQEAYRRSVY